MMIENGCPVVLKAAGTSDVSYITELILILLNSRMNNIYCH